MSMQQDIRIHQTVIERFARLERSGRLAHAYLFIGPVNIGKSETAVAVAKLVNCERRDGAMFCDQCPSCVKINAGNHPDVVVIDKEFGESIKIEDIRQLGQRIRLRPFLAGKKVCVIRNIETMTTDAANAFLKTLEEPAADSLLLLTTSVREKNLDTIRSRCHAVHFEAVASEELKRQIKKGYSVSDEESHFIAYFAQGCPGTAHQLSREGFIEKKNALIDEYILRRPDEVDIKALLADKAETKTFLDVLYSWIRDAVLAKAGVEDARLVHVDRLGDLKRFVRRFSFDDLRGINGAVVKMHQLLADNLNIKLPLLIIGEQLWNR